MSSFTSLSIGDGEGNGKAGDDSVDVGVDGGGGSLGEEEEDYASKRGKVVWKL